MCSPKIFVSTLIYSSRYPYLTVCRLNKKKSTKGSKYKAGTTREKESLFFLIFPSFIIYSLVSDIHSVNSLRMREGKMPHAWFWHTFFVPFLSLLFFSPNVYMRKWCSFLKRESEKHFHPIARQANIWDGKIKFFFLFSQRYIINMIFRENLMPHKKGFRNFSSYFHRYLSYDTKIISFYGSNTNALFCMTSARPC